MNNVQLIVLISSMYIPAFLILGGIYRILDLVEILVQELDDDTK